MFNNVFYLDEKQNDLVMNKNEELNNNQFYQHISTGEFVDKVSFYNIRDFNKKNKTLIQLY